MPTCLRSEEVTESSLLGKSFTVGQTCGHRAARLRDEVGLAFHLLGPDATVMLVAPKDQLDRIVEHALGNGLLWAMFDTFIRSRWARCSPVLMNQEQVEPVVRRNATVAVPRHEHLDAVGPKLIVEANVLDVAYTVEAEVGGAFA